MGIGICEPPLAMAAAATKKIGATFEPDSVLNKSVARSETGKGLSIIFLKGRQSLKEGDNKMQTEMVEDGTSTGAKFAHLAARAAEGKMLAEDFVEIGKRKAQRMIRRGREAGEDCLEETTHCIKHHPWQSVALAAGAGAFAGLLFGWTCLRARK